VVRKSVIVVLAVFALGMFMAATASAVSFLSAEWLVNGSVITANLPVLAEGELLFEDTKVNALFGAKTMALCSVSLTGTVGVSGAGKVEMLWNLGETTLIAEKALEATGLTCTGQENCEKPVAWVVHLPWNSLLELMEDTTTYSVVLFSNSGAGNPGWYLECEDLGIKAEDECTAAEDVAEEVNIAGGVKSFSPKHLQN